MTRSPGSKEVSFTDVIDKRLPVSKKQHVSLVKNSSKKRRTEAEKDSFRGKFNSGELSMLIKDLK